MQGLDGTQDQPQLSESQENVMTQHVDGKDVKASAMSENMKVALASENIIKRFKTEPQVQVFAEHAESRKTEGIADVSPAEGLTSRPGADGNDGKHPPKRKMMRFDFGLKSPKASEHTCRKQVCPKEPPRICILCNAICDTQATFDSHIGGKKHSSRIKRFQGQAVYGLLNVYIPPNQLTIYNNTSGVEPLIFGLRTPQMVSLMEHHHQVEQVGQTILPQTVHAGVLQNYEGLWTKEQPASEALPGETSVEAESAPTSMKGVVEPNTTSLITKDGSVEAGTAYAITDVAAKCEGAKEIPVGMDTVSETIDAVESEAGFATEGVVLGTGNAITADNNIVRAETRFVAGDDIATPGHGVAFAGHAIPGLGLRVQNSSAKNEIGHQALSSCRTVAEQF